MKFKDLPRFTSEGSYRVNQSWDHLENWIERHLEMGLDIDPDFQRGHVWTEDQQRAFVEFGLQGGQGSNELRYNCVGWMGDFRGPFVLVDGKQRLEAVRKFLKDELTVFDGIVFSEFEGRLPHYAEFVVMVNNLSTRTEVLKWYLEINTGGVVHTKEELDKVRNLLKEEN
jgi:hypothetical protein